MLCSDKTGTLTQGEMQLVAATDALGAEDPRVLELAAVTSHFQSGVRNPLDDAILRAAPMPGGWTKLDEVPFDFERRRTSVAGAHDGRVTLIVKGAPEHVASVCTTFRVGSDVRPLDDAALASVMSVVQDCGARGLRTVAVAWRDMPQRDAYTKADETDLTLAGWTRSPIRRWPTPGRRSTHWRAMACRSRS